MRKAERMKQIERYVSGHDFVTLNELSEKFAVHINTIRSDVSELVQLGVLNKTYGGVTSKSARIPSSFDERLSIDTETKQVIGQLAAELLEEDDVIYVDSGTTVQTIFNATKLPRHLTVITNNISVINHTFAFPDYTVFVLPGRLERELNCFASLETIDSIQTYNINKAFIGVRGISKNGELSSASQIDAKMKKTIITVSQSVILMAAAYKVEHPSIINYASLRDVDIWVCNDETELIRELCEVNDSKLITPAGQ